jgi:cytochrome c-type biogenesis protein
MSTDLTFALAFLAGLLSFLSPCILPVLPSFLGYVSGVSLSKSALQLPSHRLRLHLAWHSFLFSLGFLSVFLAVGASIGWAGQFFILNQHTLQIVGGFLIFFLALWTLGLFHHPVFQKEIRWAHPKFLEHLGPFRSFGVGVLFSFGWAPCYGPITGAILTLVAVKGHLSQGLWLFGWYSFGFVLPFMIFSLALSHVLPWIKQSHVFLKAFRWLSAGLLFFLSFLLLTNSFSSLVTKLNPYYDQWALEDFF